MILERLKANKPTILLKGSAINKETVVLKARRKRDSIKKSCHAALIELAIGSRTKCSFAYITG